MLDFLHVLPAGLGNPRPEGSRQAAPQLLPVGADRAAHPGVSVLPAVDHLASVQRAVGHQHQQPSRGGRHHPERAVPGAP